MSIAVPPRSTPTTPTCSTAQPAQLEGLRRGSQGPDVMELQRSLNAKGANLDVDGKFGPLTEAALKGFQAKNGCTGNGRVDAGTVGALKSAPTPSTTAPATTAPAKAAPDAQAGARARGVAGEDRLRAQMGPVPTTTKATAATTTTTAEPTAALSPEQVKTGLANVEIGKAHAAEEKTVLDQVKGALEREVAELETPSQAPATAADQAVLAGRRGQLDAVTKAGDVVEMKLKGYDEAASAIKDGLLTETEGKALTSIDTAVKTSEAAITQQMTAASSLVDRGLKAGGRGSPTLGLKKPEAPATAAAPGSTAISSQNVAVGQQRLATAVGGAKQELTAIGNARATVEAEVKTLQGLPNRTPADDAVLAGRQAQLKVLGDATKHVEVRIAGMEAASRAIGDGVLTDTEAKALATVDSTVKAAEQALAAQASVVSEMIRRGLAAGGRGSNELL
jgi:peptidoglycan hydrolase-like protein with peptidoglycan-binding domain